MDAFDQERIKALMSKVAARVGTVGSGVREVLEWSPGIAGCVYVSPACRYGCVYIGSTAGCLYTQLLHLRMRVGTIGISMGTRASLASILREAVVILIQDPLKNKLVPEQSTTPSASPSRSAQHGRQVTGQLDVAQFAYLLVPTHTYRGSALSCSDP